MTDLALLLEPMDVLFFRDGRPFEAADTAVSTIPRPQTVAAALRSFLLERAGVDFARLARDITKGADTVSAIRDQSPDAASVFASVFRGPWFCQVARDMPMNVFVPLPADIHLTAEGRTVRLRPLEKPPSGWRGTLPGMIPLWHRGRERTKRAEGFIAHSALKVYAEGGVPDARQIVPEANLYARDRRTGIAIDSDTGSAQEGLIYGIDLLSLAPHIALYVEVKGIPAGFAEIFNRPQVLPVGGEGRRVKAWAAKKIDWPKFPGAAPDRRVILLTSPGLFEDGWKPPALAPRAAAVPGSIPVSGWDLARGRPKPNRFAAAAGSVYYLEGPGPENGIPGSLCTGEDGLSGWGTYVEGVWKHE